MKTDVLSNLASSLIAVFVYLPVASLIVPAFNVQITSLDLHLAELGG
jgi:hypothetical protein